MAEHETPTAAIAAVAPKGVKHTGYNVHCAKCGVLLRASFQGNRYMPKPDHPTFCNPCYSGRKGAR